MRKGRVPPPPPEVPLGASKGEAASTKYSRANVSFFLKTSC